eukprot:4179267-Alexandrium_andersonii.AAC.1
MSASLVGSEMCIRDSNNNNYYYYYYEGWTPTAGAPKHLCKPSLNAHYFPCLLYTSDAADDM